MDPTTVLFAIRAGVQLGDKIHRVLVDETVERALVLPVGRLAGDVSAARASEYFLRHPELTKPGGPYAGLPEVEWKSAYLTIHEIDRLLDSDEDDQAAALRVLSDLGAFEQFRDGFGADSPTRRILGEVVNVAVDYFAANPAALGRESETRGIVHAVISSLDDTDFSSDSTSSIASDLLIGALNTVSAHPGLVDDDPRVQAIVGGVTRALVLDVEALAEGDGKLGREQLVRRIGSSLLRGAATAFTDEIDLFIPNDARAQTLVHATLRATLKGLEGREDLFTNATLETLFAGALRAVGQNPRLFTDQAALQKLIARSMVEITSDLGTKTFGKDTAGAVLVVALDVAAQHVETLFDPDDPTKQFVARALAALASGFSSSLADGGNARDLLSKEQLIDLTRSVLDDVARHPELLLGETTTIEETALARIVSDVVRGLGDTSHALLTGDHLIVVVETAIHTSVNNLPGLFGLPETDPRGSLVRETVAQVVAAVKAARAGTAGGGAFVTRDLVHDLLLRLLPLASANIPVLLEDGTKRLHEGVALGLELAAGSLAGRLNGENLPDVITALLHRIANEELDPSDADAVLAAAREIVATI